MLSLCRERVFYLFKVKLFFSHLCFSGPKNTTVPHGVPYTHWIRRQVQIRIPVEDISISSLCSNLCLSMSVVSLPALCLLLLLGYRALPLRISLCLFSPCLSLPPLNFFTAMPVPVLMYPAIHIVTVRAYFSHLFCLNLLRFRLSITLLIPRSRCLQPKNYSLRVQNVR